MGKSMNSLNPSIVDLLRIIKVWLPNPQSLTPKTFIQQSNAKLVVFGQLQYFGSASF